MTAERRPPTSRLAEPDRGRRKPASLARHAAQRPAPALGASSACAILRLPAPRRHLRRRSSPRSTRTTSLLDIEPGVQARRARRASTCWAARPTSPSTSWASTATSATSSAASSTAPGSRCSIGLRDRRLRDRHRRRSSARSPASSAGGRTTCSCGSWTSCWSFPALLLAIAIVTVLGRGPASTPCSPSASWRSRSTPAIMRASVLSVREHDYVTASRALGESSRGILFRRDPAQRADAAHRRRARSGIGGASSRSRRSRSSASAPSRRPPSGAR